MDHRSVAHTRNQCHEEKALPFLPADTLQWPLNSGASCAQGELVPSLQLVIFDCDGVLVDSEALSNGVLAEMVGELGVCLSLDETVDRFVGRSLGQSVEIIAQLCGRSPPEWFLAQFAQRTKAAFTAHLKPIEGIEDLLRSLKVPFCVASNGNRAKMNFTLGLTGLLTTFAGRMYCAEDVDYPKPAPDLFLFAAQRHEAQASRCVVVEDTPTGISAARAAGMHAYGFAAMIPADRLLDAGAHAVFHNMRQLSALLLHDQRDD
ncbi:MAG: HAD-IA family hydrolase [Burkholderiaceae bacterium]